MENTPAADTAEQGSDVVLSCISTSPESCSPFIFNGHVKICGQKYPVTILRDTGATGSLLINPTGKPLKSDENILIRGVTGFDTFPKVNIELDCELVKATADVGVVASLPVPGVDLLLGNDIAGVKVFSHPSVSNKPVSVALEKQHPEVYDVCAVPRLLAKARNTLPEMCEESGMSEDTVNGSGENDGVFSCESEVPSAGEEGTLAELFEPPLPVPLNISVSEFKELQLHDPQLAPLRRIAVDESLCENGSGVVFYKKCGILWRRYRPPRVNADVRVWDSHQLVVPQQCRHQLLEMAHCGHLGVHQTLQRLRTHFFWRQMKADVTRFLKECHPCQVAGRSNQLVTVSPPASVLKQVTDSRERLAQGLQMAHTNLAQAQSKRKEWYDRKARKRSFQNNNEVSVLLPFQSHPLTAKFSGPYNVCRRVGERDYFVQTFDRRRRHQLRHVNMLKPYHRAHAIA